ncbi:CrcB family protein [Microbacterium sp.]|uniref:fluoride efflux transporter FluC n=1 Tax=Microbacterium sp. TaxID=51671 RepID=UPI002617C9AC|nr:CrcB family protein [Microbacterium sp.]
MTAVIFVIACVAGGVGAALRYLADTGVTKLTTGRFPWGIVLVNVTGSFVLGLVTASIPDQAFIVGAGLLGGYTTFSTAMLDTLVLWRDGERPASVVHLLGTFAAAAVAAVAGLVVGGLI